MIFLAVDKHVVSYFDQTCSVDEDLTSIEGLVIKLVEIQSVQSVATAIKNAPYLVLTKVAFWMATAAFLDFVFDCFEGVLYKCFDFEGSRTHILFVNLSMLDEFEEVGILYFFSAIQQSHVLLHLLLKVESKDSQLQLVSFFLAADPVFAGRNSPNDVELLIEEIFLATLFLSHQVSNNYK